jgi:hypothetical protein
LEYVVGAFAGILYGGLVGVCKYFFLWRGVLSAKDDATITMKSMYLRMFISYAVNIITLLLTYVVRNIIPFDFVAFAIATALALSLAGKIFSLQKVYQKTNIN